MFWYGHQPSLLYYGLIAKHSVKCLGDDINCVADDFNVVEFTSKPRNSGLRKTFSREQNGLEMDYCVLCVTNNRNISNPSRFIIFIIISWMLNPIVFICHLRASPSFWFLTDLSNGERSVTIGNFCYVFDSHCICCFWPLNASTGLRLLRGQWNAVYRPHQKLYKYNT